MSYCDDRFPARLTITLRFFFRRWAFVVNMLQNIKQAGLKPNLGTLNAVLFALSTMGGNNLVKSFTLKTLTEFKNIGVEPCLGSWYYVLNIFCKDSKYVISYIKIINCGNCRYSSRYSLNDKYFFKGVPEVQFYQAF